MATGFSRSSGTYDFRASFLREGRGGGLGIRGLGGLTPSLKAVRLCGGIGFLGSRVSGLGASGSWSLANLSVRGCGRFDGLRSNLAP